jgi:putative protease
MSEEFMSNWVPELLSPAGSLEKLKVAILYGANAVYLGGQKFGLREASDNFTTEELIEGVEFAHSRNCKVYVVLNSFLHDKDIDEMESFLLLLEELGVDAVIVSDLGVITEIQSKTNLVIHLSTQASCLNVESALLWKELGVSRIVLGREVTIEEAKKIKKISGLEIEMFIHGSMCMSYSGNCVISNYTQGRDSNRGGCAHSCRFEYSLKFNNDENKQNQDAIRAYFMSSKDLEGIRILKDFIDAGIDSLKVEGRNKSAHYAGTISKVYSEALSYYEENGNLESDQIYQWESELLKVPHRDYTTASLIDYADSTSIYNQREHDENEFVVCGVIVECAENSHVLVEVKSAFHPNDQLEILPFKGKNIFYSPQSISNMANEYIERTKPGTLVKLDYIPGMNKFNLLRKKI